MRLTGLLCKAMLVVGATVCVGEIMTFPTSNELGLAFIAFMAVGIAPASADLIGQTFNADISIIGALTQFQCSSER